MNSNPLGIRRFGPITFYVTDAAAEASRLGNLLGMEIAYKNSGSDCFGLQCNDTIFILDSRPDQKKLADKYGNYISEIGLYTNSANEAVSNAAKRCDCETRTCKQTGATYLKAPHDGELWFKFLDDNCKLYADLVPNSNKSASYHPAFNRVDHIVTNTQKILPVIEFFRDVFGMEKVNEFTIRVQTDDFQASLYSEVMGLRGSEHDILFPVNEPLAGDNESQIPAQLREMGRSHAQHIALCTDDIISSIKALRSNGMSFLDFRNAKHADRYYSEVPDRLGKISVKEAMDTLRKLGILVDKCGEGYLLQLFSKRLFPDRSVPFVEIIQRASDVVGCFGDGNFAALAESLEWSMRQEGAA